MCEPVDKCVEIIPATPQNYNYRGRSGKETKAHTLGLILWLTLEKSTQRALLTIQEQNSTGWRWRKFKLVDCELRETPTEEH